MESYGISVKCSLLIGVCTRQTLKNDCRLCDLNTLVTPTPAAVADVKSFSGKSTELVALGI